MKIRKPPPPWIGLGDAAPSVKVISYSKSLVDNRRMPMYRTDEIIPNNPTDCYAMVYYANLKEWQKVRLPKTYRVVPIPINEPLPTPEPARPKPVKEGNVPTAAPDAVRKGKGNGEVPINSRLALGLSSGRTIWQTWGLAFQRFAQEDDAHSRIVAYMKAEFPGRRTKFAKWVNNVRVRYNKGMLGVPPPEPKIPVLPLPTSRKR